MTHNLQPPTWSELRDIGNSRPAKLSFAFPLIGYFLLFNSWLKRLFLDIGLPDVYSTIPLLYFGFLSFSLGSIVFGLFCPRPVKEFPDALHFVAGTNATLTTVDVERYCADVSRFAPDLAMRESARGIVHILAERGLGAAVAEKILDIRKEYFAVLTRRHSFWRVVSAVFYAFGFILLGLVTLDGVYRVIVSLL